MIGKPTVELKDFKFAYSGETPLLEIPRHVFRGPGVFSIKGESGKGKSSLISLIAAHDQAAYGGSLKVLGQEWGTLARGRSDNPKVRHRRKIAFIPADYGLLGRMTVWQTLDRDLSDKGVRRKRERASRIAAVLAELEISELANKPVFKLSSGQKQRVAIARGLARKAQLIVADEPTANLDDRLSQKVIDLLKHEGRHSLVLIASHDPMVLDQCKPVFDIEAVSLVATETAGGGASRSRATVTFVSRGILACLVVLAGFFVWQSGQRDGQPADAGVAVGAPPTTQEYLFATTPMATNAPAPTATMVPSATVTVAATATRPTNAEPTWTPLTLPTEVPTWTPMPLQSEGEIPSPTPRLYFPANPQEANPRGTAPSDAPIGPNGGNPAPTSPPIEPMEPDEVPTSVVSS